MKWKQRTILIADYSWFSSFLFLSSQLLYSFRFEAIFLMMVPTFSQQLVVSEQVFAPNVADETTSFCNLARYMLPAWYQETISNLPVFVPDVQPGDVYKTRKILLKTRDLVDVFSPVYPNTTTSINNETTSRRGHVESHTSPPQYRIHGGGRVSRFTQCTRTVFARINGTKEKCRAKVEKRL